MGKTGATGISRIINAAGYSVKGLKATFKYEAAFRQELLLVILLIPLAVYLGQTGVERAIMISCLFLVLIVELLNSAVESVVDRVGDEFHELSGRAKDIGSAAVFLSLVNIIVVWLIIILN